MQINFDLKLSFTKRIIMYDGLKVCVVTLIGAKTCVTNAWLHVFGSKTINLMLQVLNMFTYNFFNIL
jgi:hypothetical protein